MTARGQCCRSLCRPARAVVLCSELTVFLSLGPGVGLPKLSHHLRDGGVARGARLPCLPFCPPTQGLSRRAD